MVDILSSTSRYHRRRFKLQWNPRCMWIDLRMGDQDAGSYIGGN